MGWRGGRRRGWMSAVVASLVVGACAPAATGPLPSGAVASGDLMIVDCLLPGQIRQLGGQVTYLSRPRALKTSARDCAIRGGEYVAFDRADYKTALKVWLPQAEQGDPKAQTYVGEIFEKGLGVPADYDAAAQYYRKAADRGYPAAALNLGSLYERGLGVPKDPTQALNWYRRASGLGELQFDITAGTQTAEVRALRAQVEQLRQQLDVKSAALTRLQHELDDTRRQLESRRSQADTERGTIAQLRRELEQTRQREGSGATQVQDLERSIAQREQTLAQREREITALRAAASSELAAAQKQAEGERAQIESLRTQLGESRREADARRERVRQLERSIADSEARVAAKDKEVVDLRAAVARLETERRDQRDQLERLRQQTASSGQGPMSGQSATDQRSGVASGPRVGLPRPRTNLAFGTYNALVIGNNDYKLLPRLKSAVNDATEVARVLEKDYGYRVRLLTNAGRYEILSALNELRERLTEKDNLLIYYAGHGERDEKNDRGQWLPIDAEPSSSANWIPNYAITDILNAMTVQQLVVVADACYSGALSRSSVGHLDPGLSDGERLRLMQVLAQKRSRMVMSSGAYNETVLDSGGGQHSPFTQAFLDLLRANVGVLPGQDMYNLLRLRVQAAADRVQMSQVPEYVPIKFAGHESGDFFFVRASN